MIRKAKERDVPSVLRLIRGNKATLLQRSTREVKSRLASMWVAEDDGRVVGCVALDVYSKKIAEVRSLAVDASHRKRGIGRALVRTALKEAKRRKIAEVLAVSSAKAFFERLHFDICLKEKYAMFWDGTLEPEDGQGGPSGSAR